MMRRLSAVMIAAAALLLPPSLGPRAQTAGPPSTGGEAAAAPAAAPVVLLAAAGGRIRPDQLTYLGAFRLPGGDTRPQTFAYGGNAMTFNPSGDPGGPDDGFPGSLFVMGHERLAYGELPDGNQIAEVTIPAPRAARTVGALPQADFIQSFHDVAAGRFAGLDEIPRVGMLYLDDPATGPRIHLAWGQHMQPDPPSPSHTSIAPDLSAPDLRPPWFIGTQSLYSVNGYMFEIPKAWAQAHAQGRVVATGRFRDGGWSGMGPALFAYRPWTSADGKPPAAGSRVPETTLLRYASSATTPDIEHAMRGYQHPDEWEGGAWLTTADGRSAVLFAGTKGTGAKYWYGYANPAGPQYPCVDEEFVGQYAVCRMADGTACPASDLVECAGHNDYRGWWSSRFDAQFIFYDPTDLARVAAGEIRAWSPQPYGGLDLDDRLFLDPPADEVPVVGAGDQRRGRIGDVAYDRSSNLLYVLELLADGAKPVVHVWRVR